MAHDADTPMIRETYKDYKITELQVYRPARKAYAIELIIQNYKI